MSFAILSVDIRSEHDMVNARQRARQVARLIGFDLQDQTRISTAVSEIARNAVNYAGGGRIEYRVEGRVSPQVFVIRVSDRGPGIRNIDDILEGRYQSQTGMGLGIIGSRRLMDQFQIETKPGGTTVVLSKLIPKLAPLLTEKEVARISQALAQDRPQNAVQELQYQNQELMRALEEVTIRQQELARVNRELEDTNRGVVALYAELDEKAEHLRRADELKSKFLSNMSHEFRSPLNSILALSGLLRDRADGPLTPEQEQQVGYIRRAAQDLLDLVNDLLDLAKVEAGKIEARPIHFEVSNLFAALRGMLRPLLLNQSVDLIFEDASHIPPLFTDEGKISQILRNFISNALKFTERGEVRVSAQMDGENQVALSVADTGIGIEPENQELIFQDFIQIDNPIQRRVKGTGLGLPLSKKLANFLGGAVEVRSQPGKGSTFTVRVPRTWRDSPGARIPELTVHVVDGQGKPVLFVEDSPEAMITYRSYLRDSGFQPVVARTTWEAETALDTITPCAIVLDIVLRSEDSWGFLASLKKDDRTKKIPVIIASTVEDQAKGFHLGADAYLSKPIDRASLLRELRTLTADPSLRRVLIVDDNELDRYLLRQHMKTLPVTISEESSGENGVGHASENRPDLILLDLTMPKMNGFEVLDELRRRPETKAIPVIIVTSRVLSDAEQSRLSGRCTAILHKDKINGTMLTGALQSTLSGMGTGSEGASES